MPETENKILRKAYDYIGQRYDVGTYEQFSQAMQDKKLRKKAYDLLGQEYDLGDFKDFSTRVGIKPFSFGKKVLANMASTGGWVAPGFEMTRGGGREEVLQSVDTFQKEVVPELHEKAGEGNWAQNLAAGVVADLPMTFATYGAAKALVGNLGKTAFRQMLITEGMQGALQGLTRPVQRPEDLAINVGGEAAASMVIAGAMDKILAPAGKKVFAGVLDKLRRQQPLTPKEADAVIKTVDKAGWFEPTKPVEQPTAGPAPTPMRPSAEETAMRGTVQDIAKNRQAGLDAASKATQAVMAEQPSAPPMDWTVEAGRMMNELEGATLQRGEGWSVSTAPDWFKRLQPSGGGKERLGGVVNKSDVTAVLKKVKDEKPLTERQQGLWERIKSEYEYEVASKTAPAPTELPEKIGAEEPIEASEWDKYVGETGETPFLEVKVGDNSEFVSKDVVERAKGQQEFAGYTEAKIKTEGYTPEKATGREDIRKYLAKEFDVPIVKGLTGGGRRAGVLGQYDLHADVAKEKIWGDVWTEAHEVAHALDKRLKITANLPRFSKSLTNELKKLDYDPTKKRTIEGFAEFIRHDLSVGDAKKLAPNFYEHWQLQLAKDPIFKAKYEGAKDLFTRYNNESAFERLMSNVDLENKPEKLPLRERVRWMWSKFIGNWQDSLKPMDEVITSARKADAIKKGVEYKPLEPQADPFQLGTYLKSTSRAKAKAWVTSGTRDVWGGHTGKSLDAILTPFKDKTKLRQFIGYTIARRALVLADRGIHVGVHLKDAEAVFRQLDNYSFRTASDEFMEWADNALQYLLEAGGISGELYSQIRALNPFYVTLKRVIEDDFGGGSGGKVGQAGQTIKKIKGGGEKIVNPIESMVMEVHRLILAADRVRVARAIADVENIEGMGKLIRKIDAPIEARDIPVESIKKQLDDMGVDTAAMDMDKVLTVFTQGWQHHGKHNVISVWKDGKRVFYEIDKRLYNALEGMDVKRLHPALDLLFGKPARLVRLMTTGINAGFGLIRNPSRDILSTAVYTKGKAITSPIRSITGVMKDVKQHLAARTFIELGGEMATLSGQDRASAMKLIDEVLLDNGTFKGKTLKVVKHPIEALRSLVQITEMGPRIGEFETVLKQAEAKWGKGHPNAMIEAFNAARDITVNFSRNGTYGAIVNQMIPFWNASVQSGAKMVKFAKEHPVQFVTRGVGAIAAPTIALYAINKDKEWYRDLPLAYKYNNWFIEIDDNTIIRIPKPFEIGVLFGGFIEAAMDQAGGIDDNALKEAAGLLIKNIYPGDIRDVTLIKPWWDLARNKDWLGRDIESQTMKRLEKPERSREYTSELAKAFSRGMSELLPEGWVLSPVQLDYLVNSYTGGQYGNVSGWGKKWQQKADVPVIKTLFLRQGGLPQRYVNQAYELNRKMEEAQATLKKYERTGDKMNYRATLARHPELKYYGEMRKLYGEVKDLIDQREKTPTKAKEIDERIRQRSEKMRSMYRQGVDAK